MLKDDRVKMGMGEGGNVRERKRWIEMDYGKWGREEKIAMVLIRTIPLPN